MSAAIRIDLCSTAEVAPGNALKGSGPHRGDHARRG
jgi:hypothetical protein